MQKGLLLRRALLSPVVGVMFSCKVDEYVCAAWQRKPGPAFLNPLNGRVFIFRMACHDNIRCSLFIVWFASLLPVATTALLITWQITAFQWQIRHKAETFFINDRKQSTHRSPRARSAKRSAKRSLVTFFGFGKKVTRLSAGTDDLDLKTSN